MTSVVIFFVVWYILIGLSSYKLFEKAREPGWKGAVPIYNLYTWLELSERPKWWLLLLLVPILNVFIYAQMIMDMLKSFERTQFHDYLLGLIATPVYFTYMSFNENVEWDGPAADLPKIEKSTLRDWTDSILFAVVAATLIRWFLIEAFTIPTPSMENSMLVGDFLFVSKVNYGPRVPETPLSFPFAHNTLPLTKGTKSYLEWIKLPYYRMPGFEDVERKDVVVFNYPADMGRPVDKKDNYIKRCIGIPGDNIKIQDDSVYVNGSFMEFPENVQFRYEVHVEQYPLRKEELNECGISLYDLVENINPQTGAPLYANADGDYMYILNMSPQAAKKLKALNKVKVLKKVNSRDPNMFMNKDGFSLGYTIHNFGEVWVPKAGETVEMNETNYYLYKDCIALYEDAGSVRLKNNKTVEIKKEGEDWKPLEEYTFTQNYYFMMGDNRHNSLDSRFWGYVPEDHIVGKAMFIWFSFDRNQDSFSERIRWNRFFKGVE